MKPHPKVPRTSSTSSIPKVSVNSAPKKKLVDSARVALKNAEVQMISSIEQTTTLQQQQITSFNRGQVIGTCSIVAPTQDAFKVRQEKGKSVRDVWVDTHDLINEPGGFVINLTKHGSSNQQQSKTLRIHLGIRQTHSRLPFSNKYFPTSGLAGSDFRPGTISATDDYAREIFQEVRHRLDLQVLYALLEINDAEDSYEPKLYEETGSPEFLRRFIQTYPTMLTKFHVEMPGLSSIYLPEWKFLLEQQTILEELICNFGVVMWTLYDETILKNSQTLKKIVLRRLQTFDVTKSTFIPMDWSIFTNCICLTYLKVTCGYKPYSRFGSSSYPPNFVFRHENIQALPNHEHFSELHLERIWVDPCQLQGFYTDRPQLKLCLGCLDKEYYDGDTYKSGKLGELINRQLNLTISKEVRMFKLSQLDFSAEISPSNLNITNGKKENNKKAVSYVVPGGTDGSGSEERKLGQIIIVLFIAILLALGVLYIIVYFKHLRQDNSSTDNVKINISLLSPPKIRTGKNKASSSSGNSSLPL